MKSVKICVVLIVGIFGATGVLLTSYSSSESQAMLNAYVQTNNSFAIFKDITSAELQESISPENEPMPTEEEWKENKAKYLGEAIERDTVYATNEYGEINGNKYQIITKTTLNGVVIPVYLFGHKNGDSWSWSGYYSSQAIADCDSLSVPVTIKIRNMKGEAENRTIKVRKELSDIMVALFEELYDTVPYFRIYEVGMQNNRSKNSTIYPTHPNGVGIDLNSNHNYYTSDKNIWNAWDKSEEAAYNNRDSDSTVIVTRDVVAVFDKYGFYWGGYWKSKKDYMHFSINDH